MTPILHRPAMMLLFVLLAGVAVGSTVLAATEPSPSGRAATLPQEESPTATPTDDPTGLAVVVLPGTTYRVFLNRDPFQPVIPVITADGGTAVPVPGTGVPGTDPGTDPGTTPTPSPSATPAPGDPTATPTDGCSQASGVVCGGQEVKVIGITQGDVPTVQVAVGGTVYDVGVGDEFAGNFEVVSIAGSCATFLFGDDLFTLCVGEGVLK